MVEYSRFAIVYDDLMAHAPYDKWVEITDKVIKSHIHSVERIVDLGCGTGEITIKLAEKNFEVIGVDYSEQMLSVAQQKTSPFMNNIQWIHQDIRHLEGFNQIDMFISYCDVINYITNKEDLLSVFQHVYNGLKVEGLFIFDIHNLSYVLENRINKTFATSLDHVSYIWDCVPGEIEGELYHELVFFERVEEQISNPSYLRERSLYEKFQETHYQRVFPYKDYIQLLKKAGFNNVELFVDFHLDTKIITENNERIFIIARK